MFRPVAHLLGGFLLSGLWQASERPALHIDHPRVGSPFAVARIPRNRLYDSIIGIRGIQVNRIVDKEGWLGVVWRGRRRGRPPRGFAEEVSGSYFAKLSTGGDPGLQEEEKPT